MRFKTTLLRAGKTATGIEVPPNIVESFGVGKRPPVAVTINGYTYRSTVAVMGGKFMVGVSADVRERAKVAGGDRIDVEITLDTKSRDVEVPADLKKALSRDAKAKAGFERLSPSNKKAITTSLEGAKTTETRERRLTKAIERLRAG